MELTYQMTAAELNESLLALNWKREGIAKQVLICVLTAFSAYFLFCYTRAPEQVYYFMMAALGVGLMLFLLYGIPARRRRKAKKLSRQQGSYHLSIRENSICTRKPDAETRIDTDTTVLTSEHMITIRTKGGTIFSIPKRVLPLRERSELDEIMQNNHCRVIQVFTERKGK